MSSKYANQERVMHSKNDKIEFMSCDKLMK